MVQTSLTYFDIVVFGILTLSGMFALFRGFIREVLSFAVWLGIGLLTLYLFPYVAQFCVAHIKDEGVAHGAAALASFILAWLVIALFNRLFLRYVKPGTEVGFLDNLMGLVFGLARGSLVIVLGYLAMMFFIDEKHPPEWLKQSVSRPYVEQGAAVVTRLAPGYLEKMVPHDGKDGKQTSGTEALDRILQQKPGPTGEDAEPSPRWQSMEELQRKMREGTKE
jgi:membrane protein required for colicin V production